MGLGTLVVTASDEGFAPLLRGLLDSLAPWSPRPFDALACFDLGLKRVTRSWVKARVSHLVDPAWDLPVDPWLRERLPHLRALTVRPFLRAYFPGYDTYLWMDADTWVQERFALDLLVEGARRTGFAGVPHEHPSYRFSEGVRAFAQRARARYFPNARLKAAGTRSVNAGVIALAGEAPHWTPWAAWFRRGLENARGRHVDDQVALNHAIREERLPVSWLPALCNWCCHLALPRFDGRRRRLCEPGPRGAPLGIIHLTGRDKNPAIRVKRMGRSARLSLRFGGGLTLKNHAPAMASKKGRGTR